MSTTDLRDEIRQQRPFTSPQQEAWLNILRTEALLTEAFERMLKPHALTAAQFNVLRILRGAGEEGLCRNEIRDRLITRMPDVTRLLDRMEEAGLVARARSTTDRRQVRTQITKAGRAVIDRLDSEVEEIHQRLMGHMSDGELATLVQLLTSARSRT